MKCVLYLHHGHVCPYAACICMSFRSKYRDCLWVGGWVGGWGNGEEVGSGIRNVCLHPRPAPSLVPRPHTSQRLDFIELGYMECYHSSQVLNIQTIYIYILVRFMTKQGLWYCVHVCMCVHLCACVMCACVCMCDVRMCVHVCVHV